MRIVIFDKCKDCLRAADDLNLYVRLIYLVIKVSSQMSAERQFRKFSSDHQMWPEFLVMFP